MGRKILLVFSFVFSILLLVGCGNESESNTKPKNTDTQGQSYVNVTRVDEMFKKANNVYEAELIECTKAETESGSKVHVNFSIKVKIKFVYKGDFIPGEDIVEDMVVMHYKKNLNAGSTYLFMTGMDEVDLLGESRIDFLYGDSIFHAIEKTEKDGFVPVLANNGYIGDKKYKKYSEIIYDMLNLKEAEWAYGEWLTDDTTYTGITLEKMYELADNVYMGEIIEVQSIGEAEILVDGYSKNFETCNITKVKVKVLSVAKGDYVPGQIIEDLIPFHYTTYYTTVQKFGNSFLYFTGDDFFADYKEMLNGEKTMIELS